MNAKQILENWGNWNRVDTGRPKGYPTTSPMFAGHGKFTDSAWGDPEAAPEPARPPINVALAERADAIIGTMELLPKLVLINEFYLRTSKFKRMTGADYCNNLDAAIRLFADLMDMPEQSRKAQTYKLLEMAEPSPARNQAIAKMVGVSIRYVQQKAKELGLDRRALKSESARMFHTRNANNQQQKANT